MLKERIRVGVLMGGKSGEREVSLASGCHLVRTLDPTKYEVYPIELGMDGKWYLHHIDSPLLSEPRTIGTEPPTADTYEPPTANDSELVTGRVMKSRIDVLFLALHGPGGEDGAIQGYLETLGIPYVGSGILASALTMDKGRCKTFIQASGLPTPNWILLRKNQWEKETEKFRQRALADFPDGMVVKPNNLGSSIGISVLSAGENPFDAIERAFLVDSEVLIEARIQGKELTCGVYGQENPEVLPVTEIRPKNEFFDYESKYQAGASEEITPAEISDELAREVQSLARNAHLAFGCRGITRTDFMVVDEKPSIIEVNTIPGMTSVSIIPRACEAAGLDFEVILDRVIGEALFREELIPVA
ncbi:MAG: D-alanine--D-alanine ligase [Candidatus Omnitrophica bacterium]|nr:D-alanine--D-alanine ligase [Candidatus Omnitrophota bacterium]MCA9435803.1 D-alanine--D-alanine ligase [Candidatus Omnitrophota bacterium]